ncbi:4'-phosphopantetheinyl transferase superfamily protein [Streptomyces roseicoloratus]|uniref:4'-phosphopantetheinyl transferase superfamily protein n=1 Tax=Streptomyces roseicoloratus TaxID=2508722 RepID=A0ABY9S2B6_9ACTN|nr:4'-phosphopantetheinyl transferase superfamily protein [Streptomyces roseicoloratus]WMX48577.1 4'-phosphopantetheinyl transferase superfamily protein [Streptomyces roseicoloratus]
MTSDEVVVWSVPLPGAARDGDLALLDDAERARADRYLRPGDRASFVAGRAALRRVLAEHLGVGAGAIVWGRAPCPGCGSERHGPPRIAGPPTPLTFGFSRSGAWALVAVAPSGPVGVDVEALRTLDVRETAALSLSPRESAYVLGLPHEERLRAFHRAWVRKEAVTKAVGVGIATDLRRVDVSPDRTGTVTVRCDAGTGPDTWTVTDLDVGEEAVAALALPGTPRQPAIHARCWGTLESRKGIR